jgi:adenylate cyclase
MKFVILNVEIVESTKLSMILPLDRLTKLIQTFNQEMSLIDKEFGGCSKIYGRRGSCVFF